MVFYENLLQVSYRNQALILDLDHPKQDREVKFIYNTQQFVDLENYIDTGFINTLAYPKKDGETEVSKHRIIISNEHNNLHFKKKQKTWSYEGREE